MNTTIKHVPLILLGAICFILSCTQEKEKATEATTADSATTSLAGFPDKAIYHEFKTRVNDSPGAIKKKPDPRFSNYTTEQLLDHLKAIYGKDGRKNLYEIDAKSDSLLVNDAGKVACIVYRTQLEKKNATTYKFKGYPTYIRINGSEMCRGEKFYGEPVIAFCSAFAIGPRLMVTAGHCMDGEDLSKIALVYGFQMNDGATAQLEIPAKDIYYPVTITKISAEPDGKDFCLFEVNKSVEPRRIAHIRKEGQIGNMDKVHVIGYPSGLPLKVTIDAKVIDNSNADFFKTNLDTYQGNSGSPVFNSATHTVEGILVRGEKDFEYWNLGSCFRSKMCLENGEDCFGEDVSRTSQFTSFLKPNSLAKFNRK